MAAILGKTVFGKVRGGEWRQIALEKNGSKSGSG
jgi:hypothetical protein